MNNFEKLSCNVGELFFVKGSSVARCVQLREFHDPGVEFIMRRHSQYLSPFFDVGANVGLFSFLVFHIFGDGSSVVAFEPDTTNLEGLRRNMSKTGYTSIQVEKVAVSNNEEPLKLGKIDCGLAQKSLEDVEIVPCRTIDGFVAETGIEPSFLKVDVEGLEWSVIEGATSTLARAQTMLEMEYSLRDLPDLPVDSVKVFNPDDWILECHLRDFDHELLLSSPDLRDRAFRVKHIQTNQVFWPVVCQSLEQRKALFELLAESTQENSSRKWELFFCPRKNFQPMDEGKFGGFEVRSAL